MFRILSTLQQKIISIQLKNRGIFVSISDPAKFVLYEAYESEKAAAAHKNTPHYLKWRETVADWMEKPREGIKHTIICPEDKSKW